MSNNVGPRSKIMEYAALRPGHGTSRTWTRVIYGTLYSFTAVTMPNGERRYSVSKYNSYVGGTSYDCAWDRVHFITVPEQTKTIRILKIVWSGIDDKIYNYYKVVQYPGDISDTITAWIAPGKSSTLLDWSVSEYAEIPF